MKPVIVTAFWDVGRGDNCQIPRTNERYYLEFEQWARIQNKMIVFTDSDKVEIIRKIRAKFNLQNNTIIIPIDNIFEIENEIYEKMSKIEQENNFEYKRIPNAMSCCAKFDYAWFMKYWCISEAGKYCSKQEMLAWFDFGFNHMNHCYTDMEEFDFEWECTQTDLTKIHLYSMMDINNVSMFECLLFQFDTIMSPFQLIPAKLADRMWDAMKQAMIALLTIGVIDDDQMLLLICAKNHPEIFDVHISEMWYLALKENGARHLSTNERKVSCVYDIHEPIETAVFEGRTSKNDKNLEFCNRLLNILKKYEISS